MNGMTNAERYADISKISGLSEDIVKRVIAAERESILNSLKRGERAALIGRCVLRPEIKSKLVIGGTLKNYIDIKSDVTSSLKSSLEEMGSFEVIEDNISNEGESGIRLRQIPSLI